jgi:protocatechuate 3,4-dioxygenase beta subunit
VSERPSPHNVGTMKRRLLDTRRAAIGRIALLATPALLTGRVARSAVPLRLTPAQTEGPFYPVDLPLDSDFDLLRQGDVRYARGQASWLDGTVRDADGQPVRGASVEIWQCDVDGHYRHPRDGGRADPAFQSFGRVAVDAQGRFRFHTIRPVAYSGRTPHIHVKVKLAQRTLLTTQLYVAGDPGNDRDPLWRSLRDPLDRAALTVPFTSAADGLHAVFPIVVAA